MFYLVQSLLLLAIWGIGAYTGLYLVTITSFLLLIALNLLAILRALEENK